MSSLLEVTPSIIVFPMTPNKLVTSCIHLTNTSESSVDFKIKTTKPGMYTVLPTIGVLSGKARETIKITLMPTTEQGDSSHKFMVLAVPSDDSLTKTELWKLSSVTSTLLPVSFVAQTDAKFDSVRESIQREVIQLNEKTVKVEEECEFMKTEINRLETEIQDVANQLSDVDEPLRVEDSISYWSCWHLMMAVYIGLSIGYFV